MYFRHAMSSPVYTNTKVKVNKLLISFFKDYLSTHPLFNISGTENFLTLGKLFEQYYYIIEFCFYNSN